MNVIQRNKVEFRDTIHELINCWEFNIKSQYANLIDLTNIILIVSDRDIEKTIDQVLIGINSYQHSLNYRKLKVNDFYLIVLKLYFDNLDADIYLQFRIIPYNSYQELQYQLKYSCILFDMNYNKFKEVDLEKTEEIINKEPENMFMDYGIINLY